jgi:hypothetical protein
MSQEEQRKAIIEDASRREFEAWWDMERARVQEGRHNTKEACLLAWQACNARYEQVKMQTFWDEKDNAHGKRPLFAIKDKS